jgi:hypothetical protein
MPTPTINSSSQQLTSLASDAAVNAINDLTGTGISTNFLQTNSNLFNGINNQGFDPSLNNSFFYLSLANPLNWNKYFPYQIMILQENTPSGSSPSGFNVNSQTTYSVYNNFIVTLPIPPQSLMISSPFAISGDVTLNGYVEEHAGLPTRMITLSGTMGFMPGRDSVANTGGGNLSAVFAGTVQAATNLGNFAQALVSGGSVTPVNLYDPEDLGTGQSDPTSMVKTGYVNMRLLEILFEVYAATKAKGTKDSRNLRLGFSMYKDNYIYICTPMNFIRKKLANKPLEEQYEIKLKAWKRINWVAAPGVSNTSLSTQYSQSVFGQIANTLNNARGVLQAAKQTILAVRTDVDSAIFAPLQSVNMMINDAAGITQTLNELPSSILNDIKPDIILSWQQIGPTINTSTGINIDLNAVNESFNSNNLAITGQYTNQLFSGPAPTGAVSANLAVAQNIQTGQNVSAITAGGGVYPSGAAINSFNIGPLQQVFNNPDYFAPLLSQIKINQVSLSNSSNNLINQTITNARAITKNYIQTLIDNIQIAADAYADAVGQGNTTYNQIYNRTPLPQIRQATMQDFDVLGSFQDTISTLQSLIATKNFNPAKPTPSTLNYIAGLANASNITFDLPLSKFLIPFPYGTTLERLAAIYLGDPNRWIRNCYFKFFTNTLY